MNQTSRDSRSLIITSNSAHSTKSCDRSSAHAAELDNVRNYEVPCIRHPSLVWDYGFLGFHPLTNAMFSCPVFDNTIFSELKMLIPLVSE